MSINYIGLNVVDVVMVDDGSTLTVTANATPLATLAAEMDNSYVSEYIDGYLPTKRIKKIIQKDYEEDRMILYDHYQETAVRTSYLNKSDNKTYSIHHETRDFFTALFYIRNNLDNPKRLFLDANSLTWSCNYQVMGIETIHSCLGTIEAIKVDVYFKKLSPQKKERSDMLTNNLMNESRKLQIWFSNDSRHLPLKTHYNKKPFPVIWQLRSYE